MNTTIVDLLKNISPEQKEELREICVKIDGLLGHLKSDYDRLMLIMLCRRRRAIITGVE
jgi:hypothetical protein